MFLSAFCFDVQKLFLAWFYCATFPVACNLVGLMILGWHWTRLKSYTSVTTSEFLTSIKYLKEFAFQFHLEKCVLKLFKYSELICSVCINSGEKLIISNQNDLYGFLKLLLDKFFALFFHYEVCSM